VTVTARPDWWEHFFEGVVVSMWLQAVPAEQTEREAESLAALLALEPGAEVLDVPCGGGRVARALADRGYRVTGVDASPEFLAHARLQDGSGRVEWARRDMRDLPWPGRFDGAFCVGNSFGYLDDEGNAAFLRAVRASLAPGGRFVLETPMVLENLLGHLQPRPWWKAGDVYLLVENAYDAATTRLETEYVFVSHGRVESRRGTHRLYPYRELASLLEASGFDVATSQPWTREAHTVTFVATAV
jgi:SAM-dependent methyltransferase